MNDERWTTVDALLDAALEREPHERDTFLREACADDEPLRREVESLLAHHSGAAGFLSTPAIPDGMEGSAPSFVGRQMGSYAIQAQIGVGGMGEVYRARDGKLGRDVAIKILPRVFSTDPDRRARFDREARLLAALNHPHIGAIYGVEDSDGVRALVLELVEGDTLADRIAQGPLAVTEALSIARQIADALDAAHEKGIIHRDLKPANIKITPDGVVKVLDFGLAKGASGDASGPDLTQSPTATIGGTREGVILGTAAYMSPEQARGRPVDKRTDIWAFGCVLYEILTGTQAFSGSDLSEILAGILKSEPNWERLPADLPPVLGVCLRRCLHKDARHRLRDMGDLRLALDGAFETPALAQDTSVDGVPPRSLVWRRPQRVVAAGAFLVAVTGFTVWSLMRPGPSAARQMTRFTIQLPPTAQVSRNNVAQPMVISPDGRRILYITRQGWGSQLYSRTLDQLDWTPIKGAEGALGGRSARSVASLFMSPDGGMVGFIDGDDAIKKLPLNGDPPAIICQSCGAGVFRGASWGANGSIVFATTAAPGLMQVPEAGGVPAPLTSPPQGELHLHPHFLPDGKALLFTVRRPGEPDRIAAFSLDAHEPRMLFEGSSPRFATSGYLVFLRGAALLAAPFDSDRLQVVGDAMAVLNEVAVTGGSAWFDMSREGSLVYSPPVGVESERTLVWVDRNGTETPITAPARSYTWPRLSPDGTRVAVTVDDQEKDIWIWDFQRSGLTRFTLDRAVEHSPVWVRPDGQRLVFLSDREGPPNLFWQASDGTGPITRLTNTSNVKQPYSVSPDGMQLVFGEQVQRLDLWSLTLNGDPHPQLLRQTRFGERDAEVSPDGDWLAYSSDESGQFEIYVGPFPKVDEKQFPISTTGGHGAVWAKSAQNGLELFYQTSDGSVMAVRVETRAGFTAGNPRKVFDGMSYEPTVLGRMYDVSPDGQRFLMLKPSRRSEQAVGPASLVVVLNWHEELKARAPAR